MTYVGCNASLRKMDGNLQDQSSTSAELNNNRPNPSFRHLEMHQLQDEGFSSMNPETDEQVLRAVNADGQKPGEIVNIIEDFSNPDDTRQPLANSADERTAFVNHSAEMPCIGHTNHCLKTPGVEKQISGEAEDSSKVIPDHDAEPAVSKSVEQKEKSYKSLVNAEPMEQKKKPPESQVNAEPMEQKEKPPESRVNAEPMEQKEKPPESLVNAEPMEQKENPPESMVDAEPVEPIVEPTVSKVNMQYVRPKEKSSESKVNTEPVEQKEKLQSVRPKEKLSKSKVNTQSVRLRQRPSGSKFNPGAGGEPSNNINATHQAGANFLSEVHLIWGQARDQQGLHRDHRRTGPEPFPSSVVDLGDSQNSGGAYVKNIAFVYTE